VTVPDVEGLSIDDATDELVLSGLLVAKEEGYSRRERGTVVEQVPSPGTEVDDGTTIDVTVAVPLPRIPSVVGKKLGPARNAIRNADYKVGRVIRKRTTTQRHDLVISQRPRGKTDALPGRAVTLVVWNNVCTPGYTPCLPKGRGDYDCAGGEGEPPFTGTVIVRGFDTYGLDDDDDGVGCEAS
jgi:beta-lactam-binding protein with PASTA domain